MAVPQDPKSPYHKYVLEKRKDIPRMLYAYRKLNHVSQREIAEWMGVSWRTVNRWECGAVYPQPVHLRMLLKLLAMKEKELEDE